MGKARTASGLIMYSVQDWKVPYWIVSTASGATITVDMMKTSPFSVDYLHVCYVAITDNESHIGLILEIQCFCVYFPSIQNTCSRGIIFFN